jgi:cytoskeleton protein RodZ
MAPEAGGDGQGGVGGGVGVGIGTRLRACRERIGLTQAQAAEKLHVEARSLQALETEDFDSFGAPVFVRGHIRRYCELVGENSVELVALYNETTRAVLPPVITRMPNADRVAELRRFAVPALFALIGLVLLGVVWWVLKKGR